jgi:hypothetical protein
MKVAIRTGTFIFLAPLSGVFLDHSIVIPDRSHIRAAPEQAHKIGAAMLPKKHFFVVCQPFF